MEAVHVGCAEVIGVFVVASVVDTGEVILVMEKIRASAADVETAVVVVLATAVVVEDGCDGPKVGDGVGAVSAEVVVDVLVVGCPTVVVTAAAVVPETFDVVGATVVVMREEVVGAPAVIEGAVVVAVVAFEVVGAVVPEAVVGCPEDDVEAVVVAAVDVIGEVVDCVSVVVFVAANVE